MKQRKLVPKVSSVQQRKLLTSLQGYAVRPALGSFSSKKPQYNIVIDTSVLVSALFYGGAAQIVLKHALVNHHVILSEYIVDELIAFARRTYPKTPRRIIRLIQQTLDPYIRQYEAHEVAVRDVNDTAILQLAVHYGAAVLTSDKDILEHGGGAVPPVLSLEEYRALFGLLNG